MDTFVEQVKTLGGLLQNEQFDEHIVIVIMTLLSSMLIKFTIRKTWAGLTGSSGELSDLGLQILGVLTKPDVVNQLTLNTGRQSIIYTDTGDPDEGLEIMGNSSSRCGKFSVWIEDEVVNDQLNRTDLYKIKQIYKQLYAQVQARTVVEERQAYTTVLNRLLAE